jgi:hypothetical protein
MWTDTLIICKLNSCASCQHPMLVVMEYHLIHSKRNRNWNIHNNRILYRLRSWQYRNWNFISHETESQVCCNILYFQVNFICSKQIKDYVVWFYFHLRKFWFTYFKITWNNQYTCSKQWSVLTFINTKLKKNVEHKTLSKTEMS